MLVMLFAISIPAFSMGKGEVPYGITLQEEFSALVVSLEAGDLSLEEAITQLHELRVANGRENSPEYGLMEKLMLAVKIKEMTREQAQDRLCLLDEASVDCTGDQLQDKDQIRDRLKDQDCDNEPLGDEIKAQTRTGSSDSSGGAGNGSGSSGSGSAKG